MLPSDFTSFLWGIAIGVIGAFGAGFLKRPGEDCYSWIRNKVSPRPAADDPPQVVIHVARNDNVTATGEPTPNELEPISIDRVSVVTFDEIAKAIEKVPPLQRDYVESSYVGLRVEWDTYFKSGSRRDNMAVLLLTTDSDVGSNTIWCEVPFDEYRELGVLPAGSKIRVAGEIAKAGRWDITLKNARLFIHGK